MDTYHSPKIIAHDLRRATLVLEKVSGDTGDSFLQYIYGMAILHLEDRAGVRHKRARKLPSFEPNDPVVADLADKLIASAR